MKINFIGQGFNSINNTSVAQSLINALSNKAYNSFKCLVAFASQAGVTGLTEHILASKAHLRNFRIIIGVDQNATSKEALEAMLEWDVDSYVYYAAQRNIFHPKIYLFEGDEQASVIIGSNNLTLMGLVQNIEGSVEITFKKEEPDAENLQLQISKYFDPLLIGNDRNLQKLSSELITELLEAGIISTEEERRNLFAKEVGVKLNGQEVPAKAINKIKALFPSTGLQKIPDGFKPKRAPKIASATPVLPATLSSAVTISNPAWTYENNSPVLICEIGGPQRWKQIAFAKDNFDTFFELPSAVGTFGEINLKYLETNGDTNNLVERCRSARVKKSRNFNLEPQKVRESTINYDINNRPVIMFIKINSDNFIYHFQSNGSSFYDELKAILPASNGVNLRRMITTVGHVNGSCPSSML